MHVSTTLKALELGVAHDANPLPPTTPEFLRPQAHVAALYLQPTASTRSVHFYNKVR